MLSTLPQTQANLLEGFRLMYTAKYLAEWYEAHFQQVSKYVHATSRGHEAIQLAVGMQLKPQDFAFPYYRDDAMLLGVGMEPYHLMLQLLAKKDDPFSGGRTYYAHPSLREDDKVQIPHQSSATGMQAIPAAGAAMGVQLKEQLGIPHERGDAPFVLCSLGDACVTEGEVSEAFQMAALRQLPILFLVQDNEWDISAHAREIRAMDAYEYAQGFKGLEAITLDGTDFPAAYQQLEEVIHTIRTERRPFLVHATVPLLNHHTSGVRMEWYRDDLDEHRQRDPFPRFRQQLLDLGIEEADLQQIEKAAREQVEADFAKAEAAPDPSPQDLWDHIYAPTQVHQEKGERKPQGGQPVVMVDTALHAIEELMAADNRVLLYGQDVGGRLGGVFREAATLAQKFGDERVFNTPIQEAFIIGSTVGMSAAGFKPIVEVQFADYIFPGLNQLFTEVSRSCYLSNGKYPVNMILRVPIGAYGSGGPYHSSSVETIVSNIKGLKVAYPSNGADLKGLIKAAYQDPNPVVIFEHKGLYWSKVPGTKRAKTIEPDAEYILPFGKARIALASEEEKAASGESMTIITYGMGVHWAHQAAEHFPGHVEIVDLRTLVPLDEETVFASVRKNSRCLVLTEEPVNNSFARNLSGLIQEKCFTQLDAPVMTLGAENVPAIPLNSELEQSMLPSGEKVRAKIQEILDF
ncbi:MAG: thiamine pyrophosphate-dependent enzyme [Bacteroidota bacterium]